MAEVIEFPAGPEFDRRQIERELEKLLAGKEPEYQECARQGIKRVLDVYGAGYLPTVKMDVVVPTGVDPDIARAFAYEVCGKYKNEVAPFLRRMLLDLCVAEIKLCNTKF